MVDRKEPKEIRAKAKPAAKHFSESSPNPHGESKILQMPIRTNQRNETGGKNIPVPNTASLILPLLTNFGARGDKRARTPEPMQKSA
jgi:hypothetical protein